MSNDRKDPEDSAPNLLKLLICCVIPILASCTIFWRPTIVEAQDGGYLCRIIQSSQLTHDGEMRMGNGSVYKILGDTFSVDRRTGKMIGGPFSTDSYKQVIVFDEGSRENAYKAVVISHAPNISVINIYVEEFAVGAVKPFWGSVGSALYSGQCQ